MSNVQKLFVEVFRPKNLDMLIAPNRIKAQLNKGLIQNLLLEGPAGTGKTSTAYILAGGRNNPNCMYINASKDGRQEIIEDLKFFCSTTGFFGSDTNQKKIVIFDEVDGASSAFFNSMRAFIEEFESTTRFIMTCNIVSKIPDPIKSRVNVIKYKPINQEEENYLLTEYKNRVSYILDSIKISYTDESLDKFIKSEFPDLRKILDKLQTLHISGATTLSQDALVSTYDYGNLYDMCLSAPNPIDTYKLIQSEYGNSVEDCMDKLGTEFIEYLQLKHPNKINKIPNIIIEVAEYQNKLPNVIDGSIALQALVFTLQNILK